MPVIDAHQHFWKYNPQRDAWIDDTMVVIRKDFMPQDLHPILQANGVDGCVIVQSDQSEAENIFQLENAGNHSFVKGVVGWVDLRSDTVDKKLEHYRQYLKMKGFRHVLQNEPQRDFMLQPDFMRGIAALRQYNFTYDILIHTDQLRYIPQFVEKFPDQPFVIDHLAKPAIKKQEYSQWRKGIESVAKYENVYCKISGMITEADWHQWREDDIFPYIDGIVENFGINRIMFGSDWPVCLVAGSYASVLNIVKNYFSNFSQADRNLFFGENAIRFYNLDEA